MSVGALASKSQIRFFTAIDERSAAFMALGLASATGKATIVITTSGTAVSNLLPAAVEADRSCLPIIFITADRPARLKNCGANQTVNQEEFLLPVCRQVIQTPKEGIHQLESNFSISSIVKRTCLGALLKPGPVHLNIPIEEPLHPSYSEQKEVFMGWRPIGFKEELNQSVLDQHHVDNSLKHFPKLDPSKPGLILVGPWRGKPENLELFRKSLKEFQSLTRWPVFADPLSGVTSDQSGLIQFWELLINCSIVNIGKGIQVLRLGPLSPSKSLETFLKNLTGKQLLITEGEDRFLDPLFLAEQYSKGLNKWHLQFLKEYKDSNKKIFSKSNHLFDKLYQANEKITLYLKGKLNLEGKINEINLSRYLLTFLPKRFPLMLSSSSPIRDFLTYSGTLALTRRCFSFRGASGIDGNISLAVGISIAVGSLVLVCGDLAFLHDSNAFLLSQPKDHPLIIILIDNQGGGIFKQIGLQKIYVGNIDSLFSMPQTPNPSYIAASHKIPCRKIISFDDLKCGIAWAKQLTGPVLLHISTNATEDSLLRKEIVNDLKKIIN